MKHKYTVSDRVLKARKNMTNFSRNMAIINLLQEGKNAKDIARMYGLTHQRIYTIRKQMSKYI